MPPRVLTFGTFDDFHPGHASYLTQAQALGAELFVVVARDASVERIKGRPPLQSQEERMLGVQRAFPAATVLLGDAADFLAPIRSVGPNVIALGYDQHLPPGIDERDLPCPIVRMDAHDPHIHKSSLRRGMKN